MELETIKEMVSLLENSSLNKMKLKTEDFDLLLEKAPAQVVRNAPMALPAQETKVIDSGNTEVKASEEDESGFFIKSPMVGTFYSTPAPDKPVFVKPGDTVSEDTVVCIIEAMKVMNEVKAGVNGVVKEVLVQTAHPVEFGTKLFKIDLL